MDEIAEALDGCGRMVVRYSGTEPLLRVMIESDSDQKNERLADELISVFRNEVE
jgi:phosphoglucosamine mutase